MATTKASSDDSDESTQIHRATGSSAVGPYEKFPGEQQVGELKLLDTKNACALLDPTGRRIYLTVLAVSLCSSLAGFLLLLSWMLYMRPASGINLNTADGLSNLHPILMYTFMLSANMYATLVYRTHFSLPKRLLKLVHASLAAINISMSLLGVFAMFKAHQMKNLANFYSLHSWLGAMTNVFYLAQFVLGFGAFLKPGFSGLMRARLLPWHRFSGSALVALAAGATLTGISELVIFQDSAKAPVYSSFAPITFVANFAGLSVVLSCLTGGYLLTAPQYQRPASAEEQPLKRSPP